MKRALFGVIMLSLALAVPVFAQQQGNQPPLGKTFEERQANILKMIDQRITSLQEGKACVQAAKSDADLRACREKHREEMQNRRGGLMGGGMGPGARQPGMMNGGQQGQ